MLSQAPQTNELIFCHEPLPCTIIVTCPSNTVYPIPTGQEHPQPGYITSEKDASPHNRKPQICNPGHPETSIDNRCITNMPSYKGRETLFCMFRGNVGAVANEKPASAHAPINGRLTTAIFIEWKITHKVNVTEVTLWYGMYSNCSNHLRAVLNVASFLQVLPPSVWSQEAAGIKRPGMKIPKKNTRYSGVLHAIPHHARLKASEVLLLWPRWSS